MIACEISWLSCRETGGCFPGSRMKVDGLNGRSGKGKTSRQSKHPALLPARACLATVQNESSGQTNSKIKSSDCWVLGMFLFSAVCPLQWLDVMSNSEWNSSGDRFQVHGRNVLLIQQCIFEVLTLENLTDHSYNAIHFHGPIITLYIGFNINFKYYYIIKRLFFYYYYLLFTWILHEYYKNTVLVLL